MAIEKECNLNEVLSQIIFQTPRCIIRAFRAEDISDFMIYRNDMEWMKYQGFKGLTREAYEKALLFPDSSGGERQLAIVSRQTNRVIGDLYLKQEEKKGSCWIGYTIAPQYARQGYAYEVLSSLLCYLEEQGISLIKAAVEEGNEPSLALLKKLGFLYLAKEEDEQIFCMEPGEQVPLSAVLPPISTKQ